MHSLNFFKSDLTKMTDKSQINFGSELDRPSFYTALNSYSNLNLIYRRKLSFYFLLTLLILGILFLIFIALGSVVIFITYTQRAKIKIASEKRDICLSLNCSFGSECFFDKSKNKAFCQCNNDCDTQSKDFVCGSDNITYSSLCHLKLASCQLQTNIYVQYKGQCGEKYKTNCHLENCNFGSICKFNSSKGYECTCPSSCSEYFKINQYLKLKYFSATLFDKSDIICGSDGKDYNNLCHLMKTSCSLKKSIQIKFKGKCDPCSGIICPLDQVCVVDEDLNAACSCQQPACLTKFDNKSICGSDGKIYHNLCSIQKQTCLSKVDLQPLPITDCIQGHHPCHQLKCNYSAVCNVNKFGQATCNCPYCSKVYKPVCGSDNQTYDSICHMKKESCLFKKNIKLLHSGICVSLDYQVDLSLKQNVQTCTPENCLYDGVCLSKKVNDQLFTTTCHCHHCPKEKDLVCGSNGISYLNECELRKASCEQQRPIHVLNKGLCHSCEDLKCKYYAVCEANIYGIYECVCPQVCLRVDAPVCGSNGITYDNECELRVRSCKSQTHVNISHIGPCDKCQKISCKNGAYCDKGRCVCPSFCPKVMQETICANDGNTYQNECEMKKRACLNDMDLRPLFYGRCEDNEEDLEYEDIGSGFRE